MSGKRVIILMLVGILVTSAIMYVLYFATRQLDYVPPSEDGAGSPSPHIRMVGTLAPHWSAGRDHRGLLPL